jgi:uncharacterized protein with HEPN domain
MKDLTPMPSFCYFVVNFENVWLVVKEEIPKLKPLIKQVLTDLNKE